jgi:hypothetical protein
MIQKMLFKCVYVQRGEVAMRTPTSFLLTAAAIPAAISQITNRARTTEYYRNGGIGKRV